MKRPTVEISELRLRVPHQGPQQARRLAEIVAQHLAELPPPKEGKKISDLAVRVRTGARTSMDRTAAEIVNGVRKKLS